METDKLYKKMDEFMDLLEIFSHMPPAEKTRKKTEEVQKRLDEIVTELKEAVTKEVRSIEEKNG